MQGCRTLRPRTDSHCRARRTELGLAICKSPAASARAASAMLRQLPLDPGEMAFPVRQVRRFLRRFLHWRAFFPKNPQGIRVPSPLLFNSAA